MANDTRCTTRLPVPENIAKRCNPLPFLFQHTATSVTKWPNFSHPFPATLQEGVHSCSTKHTTFCKAITCYSSFSPHSHELSFSLVSNTFLSSSKLSSPLYLHHWQPYREWWTLFCVKIFRLLLRGTFTRPILRLNLHPGQYYSNMSTLSYRHLLFPLFHVKFFRTRLLSLFCWHGLQ